MADPREAEDLLADLVLLALAHGVSSVEYGGPLIPFLITQVQGERIIHRFLDEQPEGLSLEGSLARARAYASGLGTNVRGWVLAYEGDLPGGGRPRPAILAEAHDPDSGLTVRYAQPYRPKRPFRKGRALGNPMPLDRDTPAG